MSSWKPEVKTGKDPKWYGNALAFATKEEAQQNAEDLMMRWWNVVDYRAVESEDPITHVWADGKLALIKEEKDAQS
jgi:hypothetical protein